MAKPFSPEEIARYEQIRRTIRARMCDDGRSGRITIADVHRTLNAAGYERGYEYIKAVLSGRKRSRPVLREVSTAVRVIRSRRTRDLPDWL